MNVYKTLIIILVAALSGCALNNMSLVRLPIEQERLISELALARTDGKPRETIKEITALVITPGGLNPPGKILNVKILVDQTLASGDGDSDARHRAECECIRIIENFRKAGLSPEFSDLCVSAERPELLGNSYLRTIGPITCCAFVIAREDLLKGSPPRQTFKNFKYMK